MPLANAVVGLTLIINAIAVLDISNASVKRLGQQAGIPPKVTDGVATMLTVSKFFRTVLGLWNILVALMFIFWW